MKIYPDSSFLVALYVLTDTHTTAALAEWERLRLAPLIYTPLHRLEVRNAIRQFEFARRLTLIEVKAALRRIDHDLATGTLLHTPVNWTDALRHSERIGATHTRQTGISGADLLHLGVAVDHHVDLFLTFDERQFKTASKTSLKARMALFS
jgi:predicted nucleic acid-binding protein